MAKGMMDKLEKLRDLLEVMDPEVFQHFQDNDAGDMVFCHRWLLLTFKREFAFDDALTLFEILCSHHLELDSVQADKARDEELRQKRERDAGESGADSQAVDRNSPNNDYTFELFVCLAILRKYREPLLQTKDIADIFTFINGLIGKMNLDAILSTAEAVFFDYCRHSVKSGDAASYLLLS